MTRSSWDAVWQQVAQQIGQRTLCIRANVGAVITDAENRIVATGYNGPPAGFEHRGQPCNNWCGRGMTIPRNMMGDTVFEPANIACPAVHAEANALITSDRSRRIGGTMYVNKHPCWECCKLIANSGLATLVIRPEKATTQTHEECLDFLEMCGITVAVVG